MEKAKNEKPKEIKTQSTNPTNTSTAQTPTTLKRNVEVKPKEETEQNSTTIKRNVEVKPKEDTEQNSSSSEDEYKQKRRLRIMKHVNELSSIERKLKKDEYIRGINMDLHTPASIRRLNPNRSSSDYTETNYIMDNKNDTDGSKPRQQQRTFRFFSKLPQKQDNEKEIKTNDRKSFLNDSQSNAEGDLKTLSKENEREIKSKIHEEKSLNHDKTEKAKDDLNGLNITQRDDIRKNTAILNNILEKKDYEDNNDSRDSRDRRNSNDSKDTNKNNVVTSTTKEQKKKYNINNFYKPNKEISEDNKTHQFEPIEIYNPGTDSKPKKS